LKRFEPTTSFAVDSGVLADQLDGLALQILGLERRLLA
jgi:hypothetical protein